MNSRAALLIAALSGGFTVAIGAFAAHGLKGNITPYLLQVFEKGVQYQAWHTLALFMCAILMRIQPSKAVSYAAILFTLGIFCFSGSLYMLALTGIKWFGPITPLGGLCFIFGWIALAVSALRSTEVTP